MASPMLKRLEDDGTATDTPTLNCAASPLPTGMYIQYNCRAT
ncbi:10173_t:CDS:2 [Gigaspora rosea]|nr:10173_t:CDS:2 [Gigaspora rosea]